MGVHDSVPAGYRRGLPPCPSCGRDDAVLAVPAVHEASRATARTISQARATLDDDAAMAVDKAAARATLADTPPPAVRPALLAPAPEIRALGCGCLAFLVAIPAAIAWIVAFTGDGSAVVEPGRHHAILAVAGVFTALFAVTLAGTAVGIRRHRSVQAARPLADEVWRRGWYCTRCAIVHFAPGEEPAGVLPGQTLDPDSFRRLVWRAGGYERFFKPSAP